MTTLVTDENEILDCQDKLEKVLKYHLNQEEEFKFGFQGGNFSKITNHNGDIWYATYLIAKEVKIPRFWNGFGLYEDLSKTRSNNISMEINIAKKTFRNVVGAFARNENDEIELVHRGRLNPGVGLKPGRLKFLDWYTEQFPENVKTISDGKKTEEVICIGAISSADFIEHLSTFIRAVISFKKLSREV